MNTFTLFPLLPLELRRKIWAHTFQPQILEYSFRTTHVLCIVLTKIGEPRSYNEFSSNKPPQIPVALHICHESRSFALEHYILSSGGTEPPGPLQDYPDLKPRPIYFNPNIDVVGFENLHESMSTPACWGPLRHQARGSYGASPDFKDVKRLLLNAADWESVGMRFIVGQRRSRGPQEKFFTEFFSSLEEILIAPSFEDLGGSEAPGEDRAHSGDPRKVSLRRLSAFEKSLRMERDFRNIMVVRIPGWKPPKIRIVCSRHNMTEVMASDRIPRGGSGMEMEAIYKMIGSYKDPPPRGYWTEFGVAVLESNS
jgi:hypothetical protein